VIAVVGDMSQVRRVAEAAIDRFGARGQPAFELHVKACGKRWIRPRHACSFQGTLSERKPPS